MVPATQAQEKSNFRLTFLGTGTSQGVPVIACTCKVCTSTDPKDNRLRCSVLIEWDNHCFVIDTGPDFRQQMLRLGINRLDGVLFTHEHKDHVAGLDDIRAFNYSMQKEMAVYATPQVQEAIKREFPYIFSETPYPGAPQIKLRNLSLEPFQLFDYEVIPIQAQHFLIPVLGFRFGSLAYLTDAHQINEEEKSKLLNLDILIINALRFQKHVSHFNVEEALALIEDVKPKHAFLTHLSHQIGLHQDLANSLPAYVQPAYDGLTLSFKG